MAMKPFAVALLVVLPAQSAGAQAAPASRPWPVQASHYAKWPALTATAAMLARGYLLSRESDRWQDSLNAACSTDPCDRSPSGGYLLPRAQAAYQSSLDANGRAQDWLLGGEVTLIATGTMFLVDLLHHDSGPHNIPFTPFTVYAAPRRIGLTLDFHSAHP